MKNTLPKNIAIIGVGLIGGSIALALKKKLGRRITIFGQCRSHQNTVKAKNKHIIDETLTDSMLDQIGLFIVSTPPSAFTGVFTWLNKKASLNSVVIDTASIKKSIVVNTQNPGRKIGFIATHPMAGSEKSGFENARSGLFNNKNWFIINPEARDKKHLPIVKELVRLTGALPISISENNHDWLTGATSHTFIAMASIFTACLAKNITREKIKIAGGTGLSDMTRLAGHNIENTIGIMVANKNNVTKNLENIKGEIDIFLKHINDTHALKDYLRLAKKNRHSWFN